MNVQGVGCGTCEAAIGCDWWGPRGIELGGGDRDSVGAVSHFSRMQRCLLIRLSFLIPIRILLVNFHFKKHLYQNDYLKEWIASCDAARRYVEIKKCESRPQICGLQAPLKNDINVLDRSRHRPNCQPGSLRTPA